MEKTRSVLLTTGTATEDPVRLPAEFVVVIVASLLVFVPLDVDGDALSSTSSFSVNSSVYKILPRLGSTKPLFV
jgi:hypothetical protein